MKYLTLLAFLLVSAPVFQLHATGCEGIDNSGRGAVKKRCANGDVIGLADTCSDGSEGVEESASR